jgi:hypothetical protein
MKRPQIPTTKCKTCDGAGRLPAIGTGRVLKQEREEKGVPRTSKENEKLGLCYHFGFKASYVFDLENDRRDWSAELVSKYREAIQKAVAARCRPKRRVTNIG